MPKRKEQQEPELKGPTPKGLDAVVTIQVSTKEGTETRHYRVPGFAGNTLAWQRSGKGLDDLLMPALQRAFGGHVE